MLHSMRHWFSKAVLAAVLLSGTAMAHNYHMGLADIGYNADTGNTEIVHTYTAHDVEALLTNLYGRQFDLGLEEDQEALRRYLDRRFVLTANGRRLPLQWVGIKASADTITVYQQICLLYTSPSPRDRQKSRMPSSA